MAGESAFYIEVTSGPDRGRRLDLPEGAVVIGRSSTNALALKDPLLSRQHCQLTRRGQEVEIADLESANGTFVNGAEVKTAPLKPGDEVVIGETRLAFHAENNAAQDAAPAQTAAAPLVDLGFEAPSGDAGETPARPNWRPLLWAVAAVAAAAVAASLILRGGGEEPTPEIATPTEVKPLPLVIDYEKVEATSENIFRYRMALSPSRMLSIEIDDLAEDRHVRKEAAVSEESALRLARRLEQAGLHAVEHPSPGISPSGNLTRRALRIAAGKRIAEAAVENRVAPPTFAALCDLLETFGRNELGIWAIQYPAEKLIEMANECLTRAQNLYEQRGIAHGNAFRAVKACQEGVFYLETVEPKPEFYADLLNVLGDAEAELSQRYEEQRFKADRAINLKEWQTAAEELRILREQIPDDNDERNADATRKLLDVENRLKKGRGK